jgi:uncharacterized membrane protein
MNTKPVSQGKILYKIHWHVLLVHFPISLFGVSFLFQVMHLFVATECFELSTNITLALGAIAMIPTTWSGWSSWKGGYKGARIILFKRKINIAFFMLGFSILLTIWRFTFFDSFASAGHGLGHWIYLAAVTILILGAITEGYYGGRLNHR